MDKKDKIRKFAARRPDAKAVFGYGSGVFKQGSISGNPQTDVIFVVDDIRRWHEDNMSCNSADYSFIGRLHLSSDNIGKIKGRNFVTYFSGVKEDDARFKYGVVETSDFNRGLLTWDNMFLVGRFHKPVLDINDEDVFEEVIKKNREGAFMIACLLCNSITDKETVFRKLCSLSYMGDARMKFAESPTKVADIVKGAYKNFEHIYTFREPYVKVLTNGSVLIDHDYILHQIDKLPCSLVDYLAEMDTDLNDIEMVRTNILKFIVQHNRSESRAQIFEGLKTNGIVRSVPYVFCKIRKKIGK